MPRLTMKMMRNGRVLYVLDDGHDLDLLRGSIDHCPPPAADPSWGHPQFTAVWCVVGDGSEVEFVQGVLVPCDDGVAVEDRPTGGHPGLPEWARPVLAEAFLRTGGFSEQDRYETEWELPEGTRPIGFSPKTLKGL